MSVDFCLSSRSFTRSIRQTELGHCVAKLIRFNFMSVDLQCSSALENLQHAVNVLMTTESDVTAVIAEAEGSRRQRHKFSDTGGIQLYCTLFLPGGEHIYRPEAEMNTYTSIMYTHA